MSEILRHIGVPIGRKIGQSIGNRAGGVSVPSKSDLDTWHKRVSGVDFTEKLAGLPGKFLPRVAKLVAGNSDYVDTGIDLSSATAIDMTMICYRGASGIITATAQGFGNAARCGILWYSDNIIYCLASNASTQSGYISYNHTGWFTLRMLYDGSGAANSDKLKLYINGVLQTLTYGAAIPASIGVLTGAVCIGRAYTGGYLYTTGLMSYVSCSKNGAISSEYHLKGHGDYEYDISTNLNHGTWNGTGTHYDFGSEGSDHPNTHGYSLWEHATSDPIQVDMAEDGSALSLTAGVNIGAGYTKTRDVAAGGTKWNMACAMVGFNETKNIGAIYEIFVRSNATRQTPASRASIWYQAGDVQTTSRYHVKEIADPRVYFDFFNVGYAGKLFNMIVTLLNSGAYDVIRSDEELQYGTDKTMDDEWKIFGHCKMKDYAVMDGDDYTYDINGYVVVA